MSFSEGFDIGYLKVFEAQQEQIFLSVTPRMQRGPGIQRDGVTPPRMTDPHTIPFVMHGIGHPLDSQLYPPSTNAFVQRAGTWTLFEHLSDFCQKHGDKYQIIGVQSCGDLTMNPWHVAFKWEEDRPVLYHLDTLGDPQSIKEPIHERTYRCLVKWKVREPKKPQYEFLDLKFDHVAHGFEVRVQGSDVHGHNYIADKIEFALSGKVIVHRGRDISLSSAIDQFQDVRHVFNVPEVKVKDTRGRDSDKINFGEHVLFHNLNARRAALASPIIIELRIPKKDLAVAWDDLRESLVSKYHYRESQDSPTSRGEFRKYSQNSVELFYRHNVYPFGVLGGANGMIVGLASGGLSGRVGNTLEGIIRIMYDFFGCEDALVLDEGFDTFHILNPNPKKRTNDPDNYKYTNEEILNQAAAFTRTRMAADQSEYADAEEKKSAIDRYPLGDNMWAWPLNKPSYDKVAEYCNQNSIVPDPLRKLDVMAVEPRRSQMRAVLIFAVRKSNASELSSTH